MSSQKENLKKKIFKKSMFAASALSTAALMLSEGSALGAALVNRTNIGTATLSNGAGFDVTGNNIVSENDLEGIVKFHASAPTPTISANVGTNKDHRLQLFLTDGDGTIVTGNIFAKTIQIANNQPALPNRAARLQDLIWNSPIDTGAKGLIVFTANTSAVFRRDITSDIDFNGQAAVLNLVSAGATIKGNVDNSDASAAAGTLAFIFKGEVTGSIGATNPINALICDVKNSNSVTIRGNVAANSIVLTKANIIDVRGNLTSTGTGVDFQKAGGILVFRETSPEPHTFASPIVNGGNGTVKVYTNLIAKNADIGTLKAIIIGNNLAGDGALTIAVDATSLNLAGLINIDNASSQLTIASTAEQTVTFNGNVEGARFTSGGNIIFDASNGALIVQGTGGQTIGAKNNLTAINILGNVTVLGGVATKLDVSGTKALNLGAGSIFTDQSTTSAGINTINIGAAEEPGNAATYILDAVNGDFVLDTSGIRFKNAASVLQLASSDALGNNKKITLNADLNPGGVGKGIVALNSATAGSFNHRRS